VRLSVAGRAVLEVDREPDEIKRRSFWLGLADPDPRPSLGGKQRADVVIVGGGFTGLWTAIHLKEAEPALEVAVLEAKSAGYGASGRNGGFALTMVGRNLHDLLRKVGPERARATHLAMRETLAAIEQFARQEGIDAAITHPGLLTVSNGPEQDLRIRQDLEAAERLGLTDVHGLSGVECQELVGSRRIRLGTFEEDALLLDPAALARGLRRSAERRGVRIFEMTPVLEVEEGDGFVEARALAGSVRAEKALIATNAYAYAVPALRRLLFTVMAYVLVTEPLTREQWERVGWRSGVGVEDKRIMPHFHRPTPDGRILWGGRDAPVLAGGPDPSREEAAWAFRRLEETFRWTFPELQDVRMARGWGGPVCGTVRSFATVGRLGRSGRIAYALGYAGHGVGPSHLVARIARDVLLERQSDLLDLPMASDRPQPLPPGPLGIWGLEVARRILQRADDRGSDRGLLVRCLLRALQ
jgi:glycine/D-amino acid oxidase-like deaminating enzyme